MDLHETIVKLTQLFYEQLLKKIIKDSNSNGSEEPVHFDENKDILDKLFECHNIDMQDVKQTIRPFYKGYAILLMRILIKMYNKE